MGNQRPSYIASLDGLRGLSIILVFMAHIGFENIVPGGLGVTIFFFISGYIITKILIDEVSVTTQVNLKAFYIRRLLRLYPPLLLMIVFFFLFLFATNNIVDLHEIVACIFYYENYYFFTHPATSSNVCKILWSLAVEEHFYIIFPFLFTLSFKNPRILLLVLLILAIIPLILRCLGTVWYSYSADVTERYCYTLSHTRFDSIIYGCISSVLLFGIRSASYIKALSNKTIFIVALIAMIGCLVFRDILFRNTVRYTLQGLSLSILIPAIINTPLYPKIKSFFSGKVIVIIGKFSYSIYLMHMIAITAVSQISGIGKSWLFYLTILALTVVLSSFSYLTVEKLAFKLRSRF
jgi:peptidoglycan/LPS O-acetylase OafA/YrhL